MGMFKEEINQTVPCPIGDVDFTVFDGKYLMRIRNEYDDYDSTIVSKEFYEAAKKEFGHFAYYKEAKKAIQRTQPGPFAHNIISLVLQELTKKTSKDNANKLIDELGLDFEKV